MSDHGHGSLDGKVQPNLLLNQWGYLKLKNMASRSNTRASYLLHRMMFKKGGRFTTADLSIERELAVDWAGTKACVMHAGMYGFLYINLKGRQPDGVVEPGDFERLRDEIREKLACRHLADTFGQDDQGLS